MTNKLLIMLLLFKILELEEISRDMRYCPIPYGKFDSISMKQPKNILHVYVIKLKCRQCSKFRTIANVQIPKML